MTRSSRRALSLSLAVILLSTFVNCARCDEKATETVQVKVRDLMLNVPVTWKQKEPLSKLRLAQFNFPAVKGDKEPAELAIYSFGGANVSDNIKRWISQFQPDGRKTKITTGEAKTGKYIFVDLSGTYKKPDGPPVQGKTIDALGYRVHAVILLIKDKGVYYLKAVGPDKTVAANGKALRTSFGAKADQEKEIKPDE